MLEQGRNAGQSANQASVSFEGISMSMEKLMQSPPSSNQRTLGSKPDLGKVPNLESRRFVPLFISPKWLLQAASCSTEEHAASLAARFATAAMQAARLKMTAE